MTTCQADDCNRQATTTKTTLLFNGKPVGKPLQLCPEHLAQARESCESVNAGFTLKEEPCT